MDADMLAVWGWYEESIVPYEWVDTQTTEVGEGGDFISLFEILFNMMTGHVEDDFEPVAPLPFVHRAELEFLRGDLGTIKSAMITWPLKRKYPYWKTVLGVELNLNTLRDNIEHNNIPIAWGIIEGIAEAWLIAVDGVVESDFE